jgi:hypothetical protein
MRPSDGHGAFWLRAALFASAAIAACSLNPQPLPPDNPSDAGRGSDVLAASTGEAGGGGGPDSGSTDSAPVLEDGGGEAGTGLDGATEGGETGAEEGGSPDASDAGAADASDGGG